MVKNKIQNQINLLNSKSGEFIVGIKEADKIFESIELAEGDKELLGLEGNFTKTFFKEYFREINWWRRMPESKTRCPEFSFRYGLYIYV